MASRSVWKTGRSDNLNTYRPISRHAGCQMRSSSKPAVKSCQVCPLSDFYLKEAVYYGKESGCQLTANCSTFGNFFLFIALMWTLIGHNKCQQKSLSVSNPTSSDFTYTFHLVNWMFEVIFFTCKTRYKGPVTPLQLSCRAGDQIRWNFARRLKCTVGNFAQKSDFLEPIFPKLEIA